MYSDIEAIWMTKRSLKNCLLYHNLYINIIIFSFFLSYQQRGLRCRHGPDPTQHRAHGHHCGPHLGGEYLRGQHVNDGKRDGYRELADHEHDQFDYG